MRFRDSLFAPFALAVVLLGAVTGLLMHLAVRGPVRLALERIEQAPLAMANAEAVRIAAEQLEALPNRGRGASPEEIREVLRRTLRAFDTWNDVTPSAEYHVLVADEAGRVLSDPDRLAPHDAPLPFLEGGRHREGRWTSRNGAEMLLRRSWFPPLRIHVYSAVSTEHASRETTALLRWIYLVGATGFTAMMGAFFLIARRRIQAPLLELVAHARRLAEAERFDETLSPAPEDAGGEPGVLAAALNRMVEAVRDRQRRLAELARYPEMTPSPILKLGLDGTLLYANPSARAVAAAAGLPAEHPERLLPPELPALGETLRSTAGKPLWLSHTVGGRTFEFTLFGLEDEGAVIFHGVDVTSRKAMEEQLLQSQRLEILGKTAGGMAHDFNNLLVGILGNASLLQEKRLDPAAAERTVDTIVSAAERGAQLTRQLLSFARHRTHDRSVLSLNRLVEETEAILGGILPPQVRIETALDPDLPPVMGDASQLHQCVMNLCINARDAMPEGGTVRVATSLLPLPEGRRYPLYAIAPGEYVSLRVSDEGHGMDASVLGRIYEPFFTTKEEAGTGLGLPMVYNIVKSHGGYIEVKSAPGEGTVVEILLPRTEGPLPAVPPLREGPGGDPSRSAGTVLLVDDEELVRDVARAMLSSLGFEVIAARDGREGVERFREGRGRIDLVLMDLMMPVLDGRRAFEEIRAIDPEARVIISSGYSGEEDVEGLRRMGALSVLPKPYTFRALAEALRDLPPR